MLRRYLSICGLLVASLLLHAAAAYGAPGDPERGSPSEGIYELPLEKGREDAAPGSGGTTAPEGGGGGESGGKTSPGSEGGGEEEPSSNYRSENNFGSSSEVPGAGDTPVSSDGAGVGAGRGGDGGSGGAGAATANAGSGSSGGSGAGATEVDRTAAEVADTGNTSVAGNLALLAVIVALAAAVGVFARRRLSARQRPI